MPQSRFTFRAVSSPANVVRSMHLTACRSHAACQSFFTERRLPWVAALRRTELASTQTDSTQERSSSLIGLRAWPLLFTVLTTSLLWGVALRFMVKGC